jgi:hypothetical protein
MADAQPEARSWSFSPEPLVVAAIFVGQFTASPKTHAGRIPPGQITLPTPHMTVDGTLKIAATTRADVFMVSQQVFP